MTPKERQALREKHRWQMNNEGDDRCNGCFSYEYPCDVIKVLDATEPATDCTHIIGPMMLPEGWDVIEHGQTSFAFNYCPKCGGECD